MQPRALSRAWKTGGFIRRLSGLTLEPSTLDACVDSWIASLQATRASQTASQGDRGGQPMTAGLSTKSSVCSMKAGLIVSSARTSQGTRTDSLKPSPQHWSGWVSALRQEYSARPRSAPVTDETDCSSWPTASANQFECEAETLLARREREKARGINGNGFGLTLAGAVAIRWPTASARDGDARRAPTKPGSQAWANKVERGAVNAAGMLSDDLSSSAVAWATPQAHDAMTPKTAEQIEAMRDRATPRKSGGKPGIKNLNEQATLMQVSAWPTPAARDHKGENSPQHVTETGTGRKHMDQLPNFVAHASHSARPDPSTPAGPTSSPERRTLNPLFVEWLMGWPIGWTGSGPLATECSRWLRRMRGELSRLVSQASERSDGQMVMFA